jgi:hypothetical protein
LSSSSSVTETADSTTKPITAVSSEVKKWRSIWPPMRFAWKPMRRRSGAAKTALSAVGNPRDPPCQRGQSAGGDGILPLPSFGEQRHSADDVRAAAR